MSRKLPRTLFLEQADLTQDPVKIYEECKAAGHKDTTMQHVYVARQRARQAGVEIRQEKSEGDSKGRSRGKYPHHSRKIKPVQEYLKTVSNLLDLSGNTTIKMCEKEGFFGVTASDVESARRKARKRDAKQEKERVKEKCISIATSIIMESFQCSEEIARSTYQKILVDTELYLDEQN